MKRIHQFLALMLLSCCTTIATAQNIANNVVGSSGGSGLLANGSSMYFTIGETVITTTPLGNNVQLTQGFHQKNAVNVLPVSLTLFTAVAKGNAHHLNWTTTSETNNDYFVIERSVNDNVFLPLKSIDSKALDGNSGTELNYSYANYNIKTGINYYRLKQFDKDGKYHYSKVVDLTAKELATHTVQLFPNPVVKDANLQIIGQLGKAAKAQIFDISGKIVAEFKIVQELSQISTNGLASGTYVLQYTDGDVKQNIKFVKL